MQGAEAGKVAAARTAVEQCVRPGLTLALGTGSTAAAAVRAIADRFPSGGFDCVASSRATEELARAVGLAVRPLRGPDRFDVMLDGADEVDPHLCLTKGGGGALFREKLLATRAVTLVIVVDSTKLVTALGTRAPIPVEVVPFARDALTADLSAEGWTVRLRQGPDGAAYLTDNGNEILDLAPAGPIMDPAATDRTLRDHVGVVATGLFVGMTGRLFVGYPDGHAEEHGPLP